MYIFSFLNAAKILIRGNSVETLAVGILVLKVYIVFHFVVMKMDGIMFF